MVTHFTFSGHGNKSVHVNFEFVTRLTNPSKGVKTFSPALDFPIKYIEEFDKVGIDQDGMFRIDF